MLHTIFTSLKIIALVFAGLLLHYVLPQHDVARITGTEVIRQDFNSFNRMFFAQGDSGASPTQNRDVLFVNAVRKQTYLLGFIRGGDDVMVYRNEDTGWIWPPYFKFDTRDLQGEAQNFISTQANPRWVSITHYGWRNRFITIFPNIIAIKEVDGPDYRPIPWFNIFFFIFLGAAFLFVRRMWRQFRERMVDPLIDSAEDRYDEVQADVSETKGRIGRWFGSFRK